MKPFLLSFNPSVVSRDDILSHLDTLPDVKNWYAFGEAAILLISMASAPQLSALIHNRFPGLFFVVAEVSPTTIDGWQPKMVWDFITNPTPSGRWPV